MPAVTIASTKGAPSSIEDALYVLDAKETPFTSRMNKGQSVTELLHEYKVQLTKGITKSGASDGEPVGESSGAEPEEMVACRAGIFKSSPRVADLAKYRVTRGQTIGAKPGINRGKSSHMARALYAHMKSAKRGMEVEALSDQDSQPDRGKGNGSKFRGLGKWLQTTAQTDQPVPSTIRTPSAQIYTGAIADFNEGSLETLLQGRFEKAGHGAELIAYVAPALKKQISTFNKRRATDSGYEAIVRYTNGEEKTASIGVDFFDGDFGTVEVHLSSFMPSDQRGYVTDMAHCTMLPYGPGTDEEDLGNDGGGEAKVLRSMYLWNPGDPRAHCKIIPSGETAITY